MNDEMWVATGLEKFVDLNLECVPSLERLKN